MCFFTLSDESSVSRSGRPRRKAATRVADTNVSKVSKKETKGHTVSPNKVCWEFYCKPTMWYFEFVIDLCVQFPINMALYLKHSFNFIALILLYIFSVLYPFILIDRLLVLKFWYTITYYFCSCYRLRVNSMLICQTLMT